MELSGENQGARWTPLIDAGQVPPGEIIRVQVPEGVFAVCNHQGRYYVVDNRCPHAEGSLGRGALEGGQIICPVHRWPWDLRTGLTDPGYPSMRLRFFACRIHEGRVWADLTHPIPPEDCGWADPPGRTGEP